MPKTLDETYDRILLNIHEDYSQDVFKVLQWLAFSARPMKLVEVAEVIAIDFDDGPQINYDLQLQNPLDLLTICSSLVTVSSSALKSNYQDMGEVANKDTDYTQSLSLEVMEL